MYEDKMYEMLMVHNCYLTSVMYLWVCVHVKQKESICTS